MNAECAYCGHQLWRAPSEVKRYHRFFCNRACRGKWETEQAQRLCDWCGKLFSPKHLSRNRHFFCSQECYGKWQSANRVGENAANWRDRPIELTCATCGKAFRRVIYTEAKSRYCSCECQAIGARESFRGEKNPAWRGGVTALRRSRHHQRSWPNEVKERAGHRCELCGSTERLHAHHIVSYAEAPERANDPENGMCLCERCHRAAHSRHPVLEVSFSGGA